MKKEIEVTDEDVYAYLHELAEKAVTIQEGEKVGRWTRGDRVAVVYSALCAIYRTNKAKKQESA